MSTKLELLTWLFLCVTVAAAQNAPPASVDHHSAPAPRVCTRCVRAHMDFLASDALRGRGSGTQDEWIAATYIASELEQYGVQPAGDNGGYLQTAAILRRKVTAPPQVTVTSPSSAAAPTVWTHGKQILALFVGQTEFSGPLRKIDVGKQPEENAEAGSVVFLTGKKNLQDDISRYESKGVAAVLFQGSERLQARWESLGSKLPSLPVEVKETAPSELREPFSVIALTPQAAATLSKLPDGTDVSMTVPSGEPETSHTWNVVARITGTDRTQKHHVVLLTAHLDHLGVGAPVNGDDIYNGADDDASGTTAVLELARVLASQPKPRRTVIFALFGSEETGGLGSTYFRQHPPVPLKDIAAYLEFEMIGRPDPAVPRDTLWLTGWKRTDLGPTLATHGAHLVADPHPDQHFFRRSDNYVFAKQGVVAQTLSSYGLHPDYHEPSDDLAHIDFKHMDEAIGSMLTPVLWLVDSDFVPHWKQGEKP